MKLYWHATMHVLAEYHFHLCSLKHIKLYTRNDVTMHWREVVTNQYHNYIKRKVELA